MTEFVEYDACRAKPGSPDLCSGCLSNRRTITKLERKLEIATLEKRLQQLRQIDEDDDGQGDGGCFPG